MFEEDNRERSIRACIIPSGTIKMKALQLGPGENGIVVDYEFKENQTAKADKELNPESKDIVPITRRKFLLYMQKQAG